MFGFKRILKYKEAMKKATVVNAIVDGDKTNIICPECGCIAFESSEIPWWMYSGYCYRCGQLLTWGKDKINND